MKHPTNDEITRAIALGKKYGVFDNRKGRAAIRAWSLGVANRTAVRIILSLVQPLLRSEALGELNPFGRSVARTGELVLGKDPVGGQVVRMPVQDLRQGSLVVGNSGSGKTNTISFLAIQLATLGVTVWSCDLFKNQIRHWRRAFARAAQELVVLRPQDWKINFLDPGLSDPRMHLAQTIDLHVRILGLPARSRNLLRQACHEEYRRFGVWDGHTDAYPNWYDVFEHIRRMEGVHSAARDATLDRLGTLLTALGPRVAAYRRGWRPIELARHSIDFEMGGAPEFVKQLLLESVLFGVTRHEIERGVPNAPLSLVIIFDDTQRLVDATSAMGSGEVAPLDELAGVIRGSGLGMLFSVQTTQGLSRRLTPNLATKLFGRVGSGEDVRRMAGEIALDHEMAEWARRNLRTGLFAGQLGSGSPRDPFLVQVPLIDIPPVVTDDDVAHSIAALRDLPVVPSPEYADWEAFPTTRTSFADDMGESLSEVELRFLRVIIESPGLPSSRYSALARMNGKSAAKTRRKLVAEGYLREHSVATAGRGRPSIVLEPLDKAVEAVKGNEA